MRLVLAALLVRKRGLEVKKIVYAVLLAALVFVVIFGINSRRNLQPEEKQKILESQENTSLYGGINQAIQENIFDAGIIDASFRVRVATAQEEEDKIYTFLQGPKSFEEKRPWSGEWCQVIVKKNSFGGFGCGHCCMANIYSSLSPYECSPLDMFHYATQVTDYYPSRESGAIGWHDMRTTLRAAGLTCDLHRKPGTYEEFQEQMRESQSAIVLVCSGNDDTFWKDTGGHYVNIWLYQPDSDMVFLAEPGDPDNNRTWIPLRYVYDALKTISQYQYLSVAEYVEENNPWKWNGIHDVWNGR